MMIDKIGDQLQFIKIGIVITVIADVKDYPNSNTAKSFQYAGVYMACTQFNTAQPI